MALNNDLETFGRRLNNLEDPQNYIRFGTFIRYEEGTEDEQTNIAVRTSSADGHAHSVVITRAQRNPPSGRFLRGDVGWREDNESKKGVAILVAPRITINFGAGRFPRPLNGGDQVILLFVSGLIFAIPFTENPG